MDQTVQLSLQTIPFVLTTILSWLYSLYGNPDAIPNTVKKIIPVVLGIFLAVGVMFSTLTIDKMTFSIVLSYVLTGFVLGTSAIGINQLSKPEKTASVTPAVK